MYESVPPTSPGHETSRLPGRPDVLFIATASYSGSTLLGLLLDQHPHVVSTSQLVHLPMYAARPDRGACTCGVAIGACPFWSAVADRLAPEAADPAATLAALQIAPRPPARPGVLGRLDQLAVHAALLGAPPSSLVRLRPLFASLDAVIANAICFLEIVDAIRAERVGAVVVDASKDWSLQLALWAHAPQRVRFVHLVRDGRAVMASRMRRLGETAPQAARAWRVHNRVLLRSQARLPLGERMRLHYEELCRRPQESIRAVLRHAGLEAGELAVTLRRDDSHLVGGNPMRYRQDETEIEVDERWRVDLDAADLRVFERTAGRLNRRFGYS